MDLENVPVYETMTPEDNAQAIKILVGSATNFKGAPEPGDYYKRPLMIDAWSQTNVKDFSILHEIILKDRQSQREEELQLKIEDLEENLRAHKDLLTKIHATSARTSVILSPQQ